MGGDRSPSRRDLSTFDISSQEAYLILFSLCAAYFLLISKYFYCNDIHFPFLPFVSFSASLFIFIIYRRTTNRPVSYMSYTMLGFISLFPVSFQKNGCWFISFDGMGWCMRNIDDVRLLFGAPIIPPFPYLLSPVTRISTHLLFQSYNNIILLAFLSNTSLSLHMSIRKPSPTTEEWHKRRRIWVCI